MPVTNQSQEAAPPAWLPLPQALLGRSRDSERARAAVQPHMLVWHQAVSRKEACVLGNQSNAGAPRQPCHPECQRCPCMARVGMLSRSQRAPSVFVSLGLSAL